MKTIDAIIEGVNVSKSDAKDLANDLLSKFQDLSAKDKKLIMKYEGEEITEKRKRDGSLWTQEEVMSLLETNDKVLYGALKHLYACQTEDEKESASTKVHNGRGFNAYDAEFLTSICKQLLVRGTLSQRQKEVARKKLKKYAKQITDLANNTDD